MFKKILAATALLAGAASATWDYFPVPTSGLGSAEVGLYYDWDHSWSQAGLAAGARFVFIPNLELSIQGFGFQFWGEEDCNGCANGGGGIRDVTIGGRFQVSPVASAFLDVHLPTGRTESDGNFTTPPGNDEMAIYLGAQFSMAIKEAPGLKFGSEAGLDWGFKHDWNGHKDYERGLELHMAGEMDYTVDKSGVTPFVGLKFKLRITECTWKTGDTERGDDSDFDDSQFNFWLGANVDINTAIYVKGYLLFRTGDMDGEATGLYAGGGFKF